jgi:aminoglycoside/choline kinase family phosphotransferase
MLQVETVQPWLATLFPHTQARLTVTPLVADASTRRYYRAQWGEAHRAYPTSCIVMVCEPWQENETPDFLAVARHLLASGVRVPEVYGLAPAEGWMCLEDFGDRTLAAAWEQGSPPERLVWGQRAMQALVHLHVTGTQRQDAACPAFRLAFDVPKLLSELQFFRQHAIEGFWQQALTEDERMAFDAACEPLCRCLAEQPRYFCHRDYHGWNIMAQANAVGILDFQDARMGPQAYDVASLLTDRGTPMLLGAELCMTLQQEYLLGFEAQTAQSVNRRDFAEQYDLVSVQRCLKAIGTFAAMHVLYQRSHYLPYIPPTLTYLRPLLPRYTILQPLAAFLRSYTPLSTA